MKDIKVFILDFVSKISNGNELVDCFGSIMKDIVVLIKWVYDLMVDIVLVLVE